MASPGRRAQNGPVPVLFASTLLLSALLLFSVQPMVARLILPPRYAGPLVTRRKASDVLGFAVFGAAVLAVAIALP